MSTAEPKVRFAVIGDYGQAGNLEGDVANLVKGWHPDFILTLGDNNYPAGEASTIDQNIGQFYHAYIFPYHGQYGDGADKNRFFPSMGNHDWLTDGAKAYLDYFGLPGNERYYHFTWGNVDFYALDSDPHEPDGVQKDSTQAQWLKDELAKSKNPWRIIFFHHPPYSSGPHGSSPWMQWPFEDWGATAVLSGHAHTFERLMIGNIPYFVDGIGDGATHYFGTPVAGSRERYNDSPGAMLVEVGQTKMKFQLYNIAGNLIDEYVQER